MTTEEMTGDNSQDNDETPGDDVSTSTNGGAKTQPVEPDTNVVMFSQDEVNRINAETKRKAERRAVNSLLEQLGLDNTGDLEAIVKAKQEADAAAMSELEKAKTAEAKAREQAEAAIKAANDKLVRAAFMAEAGKVQAQHPQDAYLLADLSEVEITDDGKVVGVENAVKVLVDSGRLSVAGKPKPANLDNGAGSGERQNEKKVQLSQEEIKAARKMGISIEDYAKNK